MTDDLRAMHVAMSGNEFVVGWSFTYPDWLAGGDGPLSGNEEAVLLDLLDAAMSPLTAGGTAGSREPWPLSPAERATATDELVAKGLVAGTGRPECPVILTSYVLRHVTLLGPEDLPRMQAEQAEWEAEQAEWDELHEEDDEDDE